ncbi:hypothetical protein HaLaN_25600 [Haematococcus lacustris]|uniref:Uncharacterized protein n=1 Tax=Haematococcus lacustris TaxID=44745 RepID=A0A6A0A2S9_HAELA|nr:hypothetical protein HaLaN_25600 [Haematococcus lacustris]
MHVLRCASGMLCCCHAVSAQQHTIADQDQHQLPPSHPPKWRDPEVYDPVKPGGEMFWERGPDGRMRPESLYDSVVHKAIGRMRTFLRRKGRRDALSLTVDVGYAIMEESTLTPGAFTPFHLSQRNVFFIPMGGRLIAVYPKHLLFVIFSPNQGLTAQEEFNVFEFLKTHVVDTVEWTCLDGTCPQQDDDWSEDLRMLIHMEYLKKHVVTIRYDARRMLARQRALQCTMESEEDWCSLIDLHPKWRDSAPRDMADPLSGSDVPSPVSSPSVASSSSSDSPPPSPPPGFQPLPRQSQPISESQTQHQVHHASKVSHE